MIYTFKSCGQFIIVRAKSVEEATAIVEKEYEGFVVRFDEELDPEGDSKIISEHLC